MESVKKRKVTKLQFELVAILIRLGGEATTEQIAEASGPSGNSFDQYRINKNAISQSLGYLHGVVKYEGMASKGNAKWRLVSDVPLVNNAKDSAQGTLGFDEK